MYTRKQIKLLESAKKTIQNYGVKILAKVLGISPGTLYSDIDPNSIGLRTNKHGFLQWVVVLEETQDFSSLEAVNAHFNRLTIPIPTKLENDYSITWLTRCAEAAKNSGKSVSNLADAILDGKLDKQELEENEALALKVLNTYGDLYLALKKTKEQLNGKDSIAI